MTGMWQAVVNSNDCVAGVDVDGIYGSITTWCTPVLPPVLSGCG
jgi:hypothetical protein